MSGKRAEIDSLYEEHARLAVLQPLAQGKPMIRGAGALDAPVVIAGEAPGEQEEHRLEPFAGPAGRELQRLCRRAGIPWQACYRTNTVAWRPSGNRTPYPYEIAASRARLLGEIQIISPQIVIAAGSVAWRALMPGDPRPLREALGWQQWLCAQRECRLLAIYHPAYLLRLHGAEKTRAEERTVEMLASMLGDASAGE